MNDIIVGENEVADVTVKLVSSEVMFDTFFHIIIICVYTIDRLCGVLLDFCSVVASNLDMLIECGFTKPSTKKDKVDVQSLAFEVRLN